MPSPKTTNKAPTSPELKAQIEQFFIKIEILFSNLYCRWQDEKEHEDFKDYSDRITKELPDGWTFVSMSKRPFQFSFSAGTDAVYAISVNSSTYQWKRLK